MTDNRRTICEFRAQLVQFLEQINVETLGVLCPSLSLNRDFIEFDPDLESRALLESWLVYRGQTGLTDPESKAVEAEMQEHGNFPPFSAFADFDPSEVSSDFLKRWLSWYGVTSFKDEEPGWWIDRAKTLQGMLHKSPDPPRTLKNLEGDFAEIKQLQSLMLETNEFFLG